MVFYDMQEFGGLEEYAVSLAGALQHLGHQVSVLSTAWVDPGNQYVRRLREQKISIVQYPRWVSHLASDWPTKEKILARVLWLSGPLIFLLASGHFLLKRQSWRQSFTSARNWLQGQLMGRFIGPDRRKPLARLILRWWRFHWRPDLLHIQGYTSNLLFVIDWAHAQKLPVVYEEHQTPDAKFDWWQDFNQSINKAATVVAVSEKSAQALRDVCGVTQPIVVRSPLLPDPLASGWQRNGKLRPHGDPKYITTVSRLYVTKGLNHLLEAIVQVRSTHPATRFRVYGDGPLRQELLEYASKLGLDGNQIFMGAFTHRELSTIMAQTDIFVMSSVLEGQPLALVEAMAYGCPIVATSVGGIPELINDGVNGLLCGPGDSVCLADKICTLIEDSALRLRLGQAARRSYEQGPFQPVSLSEHFVSIYDRVLQQAHPKLTS
jgi:glycosyltransferase involved in cell wall biosynthesis